VEDEKRLYNCGWKTLLRQGATGDT